MRDDDMVTWLREGDWVVASQIADRFEALVAEVAGLRAERGRVPESWDECADWLDAGGVVLTTYDYGGWRPTTMAAPEFRGYTWATALLDAYRLVPPPNLSPAPPGMDGGGFLGAGADVPEGWEWRYLVTLADPWFTTMRPDDDRPVQCRPSVKPAVRATVQVPLTKLVGRIIEGETEAVHRTDSPNPGMQATPRWRWRPDRRAWQHFPADTLDLDTGMVSVYAEDGES